jgi:hypothetical protein
LDRGAFVPDRETWHKIQDLEETSRVWEDTMIAAIGAGADFDKASEIADRVVETKLEYRRALRQLIAEAKKNHEA